MKQLIFILIYFVIVQNYSFAQNKIIKSWHLGAEVTYQVDHNNDGLALKLIDSLFLIYPEYKFESGYHSSIKCLRRNEELLKAKLIFLLGKERGILKSRPKTDSITHPEIRDTLIKYYIEDQSVKNTGNETAKKIHDLGLEHLFEEAKYEPYHVYIERHKRGLINILETIGYPNYKNVGSFAAGKMWLFILHQDPSFMEKYKETYRENSTSQAYAYLIDKLKVAKDEPQIYGTQVWADEHEGRGTFYPIEDPYKVDLRRMEIGLQPLSSYAKELGLKWADEKCKFEKCE